MADALCKLHEVSLPYEFPSSEVQQFFYQCQSLQIFKCKIVETENFDVFKENMANKWNMSKDGSKTVAINRNFLDSQ